MIGTRRVALAVAIAALAAPAGAQAASVTLGPPTLDAPVAGYEECTNCQAFMEMNTALAAPGAFLEAPGDGRIVAWRMVGEVAFGNVRLFTLRPRGDGSFQVVNGGPSAAAFDGVTPTPASLPVEVGDRISLLGNRDCCPFNPSNVMKIAYADLPGATSAYLPAFSVGASAMPGSAVARQLLYNATVELERPAVLGVVPQSGPTAGGAQVTIVGDHLAVATGVTFGGVPAASFSGNNRTVTAVAPPRPAGGTVDVQVQTAGGQSPASEATRFTYVSESSPKLTRFGIAPARFRAANFGGPVLAASPVGGRVSFSLDQAAAVRFSVQRAAKGRKAGKRCVKPGRGNRAKPRCTRWVAVKGAFSRAGAVGANSFRFSGRLGGKTLRAGRYRLRAAAVGPAGKRSKPASRGFEIVKR